MGKGNEDRKQTLALGGGSWIPSLPPSPSSPPSSCLLLSPLRAGLSAAWRVARFARPPACLSVWSASLAPSLRLSPSPCLPDCLSPSPPPPPLPLRARLTFAAHHPEPQGGARARHAGTCSPRLGRSARGAGGAVPAAPTARPGPCRDPSARAPPAGASPVLPRGAGSPQGLGTFPTFLVPRGGSGLSGG